MIHFILNPALKIDQVDVRTRKDSQGDINILLNDHIVAFISASTGNLHMCLMPDAHAQVLSDLGLTIEGNKLAITP